MSFYASTSTEARPLAGAPRKRPRQPRGVAYIPQAPRPRAPSVSAASASWGGHVSDTETPLTPPRTVLSDHDYDADSDAESEVTAPGGVQAVLERRPRKRAHLDLEAEAELGRGMSGLCMDREMASVEGQGPPPPPPPSSPIRLSRATFPLPDMQAPVIEEADNINDVDMRVRKPPSSIDLDAHRILVTRLSDSSSDDEEEVEEPDASSSGQVEVTDLGSTLHGDSSGMDDSHVAGAYEGGALQINPKLMSKLEELRSVIARDATAATLGLHARRWTKKIKGRGSGSSGSATPTSSRDDANAALILWRSPDELLGVRDSTSASTPAPFAFGQAAAVDVEEAHEAAPRGAAAPQASPASAPPGWPVQVTSEFAAAAPLQAYSSGDFVTSPSYAFSSPPTSAPPTVSMQHSVWPTLPEQTKTADSFWISTNDVATSDGEAMQLD